MPIIRGDRLTTLVRDQVLARFRLRWTYENLASTLSFPGDSKRQTAMAKFAADCLPLVTDEEWLQSREFHVTKAGRLAHVPRGCRQTQERN